MQLAPTQIQAINNAATIDDALALTGTMGTAHHVRIAYIKHVFGARACAGFFQATRANVNEKFAKAWSQSH